MPIDTQILMVSGQPTPNLTPLLDPELKPACAVLLVTPDMRQRADWLEGVLRPRGIRVERREVRDAYDLDDLRHQLLEVAAEHEGETIALNVTGGTKLMAIAAFDVFSSNSLPIFYVHPEFDRLIWLAPKNRPDQALAERVTFDPFLGAHGAELAPRPAGFGMAEPLKNLAEELVLNVAGFSKALAILNGAASRAKDSLLSQELFNELDRPDFRELLSWFESLDLLTLEGSCLRFQDENARFFANGGWLEQYVYAKVQELKAENPSIQDIGRGLLVSRQTPDGKVENELDVAFLAKNRLHVIECKTRGFKGETIQGGHGADALYKLHTLGPMLGGLQAKRMLVSFQPLSQPIRRRAGDLRIDLCEHKDLLQLKQRMKKWLN